MKQFITRLRSPRFSLFLAGIFGLAALIFGHFFSPPAQAGIAVCAGVGLLFIGCIAWLNRASCAK